MDLWDVSVNFLSKRVTGESFLLSDVIGLAYKWSLPIRNRPGQGVLGGNGTNQISMVFKDLLLDLKATHQGMNAFSLFGRLKDVKKFSHLSDELREVLFQESIIFVEKASKTIRENRKEISLLSRQCQHNQDLITANNYDRSLSPKEIHGIEQRSEESSDKISKVKDWKTAFELSLTRINDQKLSITKLSKLCLGALNAIDKMESNIQKEREIGHKESEYKIASLPNTLKKKDSSIELDPVYSELSQLSKMVNTLKDNMQNFEHNVKATSNTEDFEEKAKKVVQSIMNEKDQSTVSVSDVRELIDDILKETRVDESVKEQLGLLNKRIDNVSSRVEEVIPKVGPKNSLDPKEVRSEITNTIENKGQEIKKELSNEITMLSKRIDSTLLVVENAVPKSDKASVFDKDAFRTEVMSSIVHNEKEFKKEINNEINNVTKRIEIVSSNLEKSILKIDKLATFDPDRSRLEMVKLIENKGQEISKELKNDISVVTNSIHIKEDDTRELRQRIDSNHKSIEELKTEHRLQRDHASAEVISMQQMHKENRSYVEEINRNWQKKLTEINDGNKSVNISIIELNEKTLNIDQMTKENAKRYGIVDKLILDTKQWSEKQIKLKTDLKEHEAFAATQTTINAETKSTINATKADLLSLRNTYVPQETIKSVIEKETSDYIDEKTKDLHKKISDMMVGNSHLKNHIDEINDKNSLINKTTEEISEKLEKVDKLTLDTKQLTEKQLKLKDAFKEIEDFSETQKTINTETKQRIHSTKVDLLSLKNTVTAKETIKSMIEEETSDTQLQNSQLIQRLADKVSSYEKVFEEQQSTKTTAIEDFNKLCTKESVSKMIEKETSDYIDERTKDLHKKISDMNVGNNHLKNDIDQINDKNSLIGKTTEEISEKLEKLDKLTMDTKQLAEKQLKLKAAFKEIEDFSETQKAINTETKQRIHSTKVDLLSLKNTVTAKDTIKSMIEQEASDTKLQNSQLIQRLTDKVSSYEKVFEEQQSTKTKAIEGLSNLCTKESVSKMIQETKENFEKFKMQIEAKNINESIKNLQQYDQILDKKIKDCKTSNTDVISNLSDSLQSKLKEDMLTINNRIVEVKDELSQFDSRFSGNFSVNDDKIATFQTNLKSFENKMTEYDSSVLRIAKFEERLTKISSKINRANETVNQYNSQMTKNIEPINKSLDHLKEKVEGFDNRRKKSSSDWNNDIEWVKNHIDIIRSEIKSKVSELTEKIRKEHDNIDSLKLETHSKLNAFETEQKQYTQGLDKIQTENMNKQTKALMFSESKRIETTLDSKLDKNKSDITSLVQTLCGGKQSEQQEIETRISIMKKDSINGTKCIDSLESKVINVQKALNDMDNRLVKIFDDIQSQKGNGLHINSLTHDVNEIRTKAIHVDQKLEKEILQNKESKNGLHSTNLYLERQIEDTKRQLKEISTEFKSISSHNEKESGAEKTTLESIVSTMDSNKHLLINFRERLKVLEDELHLANSITFIQDNLKVLDKSVHQILSKINLNQASISDLRKLMESDEEISTCLGR